MAIPADYSEESYLKQRQLAASAPWYVRVAQAFRQGPRLWFGVVLLAFVFAAIFAPLVSPYPPLAYHPSAAEQGPSLAHLLGTDSLGRDQLSRIIYGTRISLSVGLISILMGGFVGTLLGMVAAYFQGWVDQLITMLVDALLSFPSLVLALAIAASLGPSVINIAIALAICAFPSMPAWRGVRRCKSPRRSI